MFDYQQIFESAPAPICLHDTAGRITSANPAFCQLLGYAEAELLTMNISQLVAVEQQPVRQAEIQKQLAGHSMALENEYPYVHRDGHALWLLEGHKLVKDDTRQTSFFICQYQDISQRKSRAQRLMLIEERYKLSQRHASFGVWDWNIQTNELYWSDQIAPLISGVDNGEVEASYADFIAAIHPDDRDFVSEAVRAAVEDHAEYDINHRVVWPDGTVRWIRETGDVIRDENGIPLNMIGVARDVTDHHNADLALHENTEQLKHAQSIAHVGHWSWDVASGNLFWSDEIYRIFGYQPGEFEPTYEKFIATLHPDDVAGIKQSEEIAFGEGKPHSIDHRIIRPDGSEAWVHEEAVAIKNDQGEPIRLTGTVQDISERKYLEQQLADKIEQAETANHAKSTFLSHMSHELRTPLNGILGFAQILDMENLPDHIALYVKEIMSSGWHLLDLVDDLLDLSRIDTGDIDLQPECVNLNELIKECHSMISPLLNERRLNFIASYEACEHFIHADRRRLKQVIINLLSNGIKYNRPDGELEIICKQINDRLRVFIRDTGQGIAPELLPRLFTPFDRLGKEGIEESGTGIGLVLVKRLTEKMGGDIGVASKPGKGSTFWVEFPLAVMTGNTISEQQKEYINGVTGMNNSTINVLYVEDNPANMRLIEGFIAKKDNIELLTASTATAGLDIAKQQCPDIILMDIKLPDMNGFEALARLKTLPETSAIPVIAVSAVAHEHDIAAGLNAGFVRYLTKPLNLDQLEEAMYYVLKEQGKSNSTIRQTG